MAVKDNTVGVRQDKGVIYFQSPLYRGDNTVHTEFINKSIDKLYGIFIGGANTNAGLIEADSETATTTSIINSYSSTFCTQVTLLENLAIGDKVNIRGTVNPVTTTETQSASSCKMMIEASECDFARNNLTQFTKNYEVKGHNQVVYALVTCDISYADIADVKLVLGDGNTDGEEEVLYSYRNGMNSCCILKKFTKLEAGDVLNGISGGGSNRYGNILYFIV